MSPDQLRPSGAASTAFSTTSGVRPPAQPTPAQTAIFQLCLRQAAEASEALMAVLLSQAVALANVQAAEPALLTPAANRDRATALAQAVTLLTQHVPALCSHFPEALRHTFSTAVNDGAGKHLARSVRRSDPLALMDDAQVQMQMAVAHALQSAVIDAETPLAELDALISTVQGFASVQPDFNPLRPAAYIRALEWVFAQIPVAPAVRLVWWQLTGPGFGKALCATYAQAVLLLQSANTQPAAYGVPAIPRSTDAKLNTVRFIKRLVAGNRAGHKTGSRVAGNSLNAKGQHRSAETDDTEFQISSFDYTMPAALEALEEMQQVDQALDRLAARGAPVRRLASRASPFDRMSDELADTQPLPLGATQLASLGRNELYVGLRQQARGVGQILGLEVVALMIDNIASNPQLLAPVQAVVRSFEQPLLRLAMVDPRFFSDKSHPARQLLEAIVVQNSRFETADSPAFSLFLQPLRQVVDELQHVPIESAEPFSLCLSTLSQIWNEQLQLERAQQAQVIATLRRADQRNQLALHIAQEIRARADVAEVPATVIAFATGPWSQVIAHAQLAALAPSVVSDSMGAALYGAEARAPASSLSDAEQYTALLTDLFWSVHPELAKADPNRLVKLIPAMLSRLRTGMKAIEYPQVALNGFFDALMLLHQKALMAKTLVTVNPAPVDLLATVALPAASAVWLAPSEAEVSGFLLNDFDFPSHAPASSLSFAHPVTVATSGHASLVAQSRPSEAKASVIPLGAWVDFTHDGRFMRAQLVWVSAEGTMFMFTTATGRNQSMTRTSLDKLIQQGGVTIVQSLHGLNEVFEQAMDAAEQLVLRDTLTNPPP